MRGFEKDSSLRQAVLVVGVGWGYCVAPLLSAFGSVPVYFLEPIVDVLSLLKSTGRLLELQGRVFGSPAGMSGELESLGEGVLLQVFVAPWYGRSYPSLERRVRGFFDPQKGDESTRRRFTRQWTRNFFRRFVSGGELRYLVRGKASGRPASLFVFCGAGPRLLEDLSKIRTALKAGRVRLIVADSALAPLCREGYLPDMVLSVDSGPGTAYHFQACERLTPRPGFPLPFPALTWSGGSHAVAAYFRNIHLYRSTFPLDQLLGAGPLSGIPEWRNPSRNTMGLALHLAHSLGSDRLFSAGADFLSDRDRSHVRGGGYTLYALNSVCRTRSLEMYRPGGYGATLTHKNRVAARGLEELSRELGVAILPLGSSENCDQLNVAALDRESPEFTLPERRLKARELFAHLMSVRERMGHEDSEGMLSRPLLERWAQHRRLPD